MREAAIGSMCTDVCSGESPGVLVLAHGLEAT